MTERDTGQPKVETQKGSEILDVNQYGALYGRFLLASLPGADAANIIDPDNTTITVNFNDLTEDTLKERNYNRVGEKSSLDERRDKWKDFKPTAEYPTAYSQWRTQFTGFMTGITDWKRESALRIIMPNLKKPTDFTESDADQLFNEFCKDGKSDIDKFIKQVTANLVVGKNINPEYLEDELNDLGWIASGLFGKETASNVVTRLIELESAMHNNIGQVMDTFNFNKDRINKLKDDEKRVLGLLHPYLSKEETIIPKQITVVPAATVPAPERPAPAPVTPELKKDEDDQLGIPPPPPAEKTPESGRSEQPQAEKDLVGLNKAQLTEVGRKMLSKLPKEDQDGIWIQAMNMTEANKGKSNLTLEEARRMDVANIRTILAEKTTVQPQPAVPPFVAEVKAGAEEPIHGFVVIPIEDLDKRRDPQVRIEINGIDTGFKWSTRSYNGPGRYEFTGGLVDSNKFPESLDLPEDTGVSLWFEDGTWFTIKGGKNIQVALSRKVAIMAIAIPRSDYYFVNFPSDMESGKVYKQRKIFQRESGTMDPDDWKKLLNPQAPAKSDLAPDAETPVAIEQSDLTELRRTGSMPFSLEDQPFSGISQEKRYNMTTGFFSEDEGETK